jgi:hypothetical protein
MDDVESQMVNHLGQVLILCRGDNFERRFSVIDKIPPKTPPPEGTGFNAFLLQSPNGWHTSAPKCPHDEPMGDIKSHASSVL